MRERTRMEAEFRQLEIIGCCDERTRVSINRTLDVPYRWICLLETPGSSAPGDRSLGIGSGVLIGPRHVLTSAHVLVSEKNPSVTVGDRLRVQVARNGRHEPFDAVGVRGWQVDPRWIGKPRPDAAWHPQPQFDLGLVTLSREVAGFRDRGLGRCPLAWFGAPGSCGHGSAIGMDRFGLRQERGHVAGYPAGKGDRASLWHAAGPVRWDSRRSVLAYEMDTSGGQSGAPVWIEDESGGPRLVGIHSRAGAIAVERPGTYGDNVAAPLTPEAVRMVAGWKRTYTP